MSKIIVGCSGWTFPGWRGTFYPKGLSQKKELEYASQHLSGIEVNGTFYSLQKPHTFQKWHDETPDNFVFAVKAPQYITHVRRLKDVEEPLANFMASGLFCLGKKLGPILWQFPPNVMLKDDRFEKFLDLLPHDTKEAERVAKKHSNWMKGRSLTKSDGKYPIRHGFEFRHPSFKNEKFIELMRKHGVAIVFAHCGEKSPYFEDITAKFIYARMHGQDAEYKKGYTNASLTWLSQRLKLWTAGKQPKDAQCVLKKSAPAIKRDAYIFFDTEEKVYAPQDALHLLELLKTKRAP